MSVGPTELMFVMLTSMLLPAMAALAWGVCSGAFERDEDVKYMALADRPPSSAEEGPGEPAEVSRRVAGRRER